MRVLFAQVFLLVRREVDHDQPAAGLERPRRLRDRAGGVVGVVRWNLRAKLYEWGELVANLPQSKVPVDEAWVGGLFMAVGLVGFGALLYGLWLRRREVGVLEVFTVTYVLMLWLWPGYNARFWIPLLPLIWGYLAVVGLHLLRRTRGTRGRTATRVAVHAYVAWVLLMGAGALGYSSWISWGGDRFPDRYGGGALRSVYRAADAGVAATPALSHPVDRQAYRMLRRFGYGEEEGDPRAEGVGAPSDRKR